VPVFFGPNDSQIPVVAHGRSSLSRRQRHALAG
jgi:hypothetical protein